MGYVKSNPEVGMRSAISIGKRVAQASESIEFDENSDSENNKENLLITSFKQNQSPLVMKQFSNRNRCLYI